MSKLDPRLQLLLSVLALGAIIGSALWIRPAEAPVAQVAD